MSCSIHGREIPRLAIIAGSGMQDLFRDRSAVPLTTPWGDPSSDPQVVRLGDREFVFLARHGNEHNFAPHLINYRANIWALKSMGVHAILGLSAVGSLRVDFQPGSLVCCDDFLNETSGRIDSFAKEGSLICLHMKHPYCKQLRQQIIDAAARTAIDLHTSATVVVVNGPRLSTLAESRKHIRNGADVINMTQYPECYLARELNMSYANLCLVTDYDIGVEGVESSELSGMKDTLHKSGWKLTKVVSSFVEHYKNVFDPSDSCHSNAIVRGEFFENPLEETERYARVAN